MKVIQEIFEYYKMGFRRMIDFSSSSCRKELNYFFLSYFVIWIIFAFVILVADSMLAVIIQSGMFNLFGISGATCLIFHIIHLVPLFALMRRRLNDIIPAKSGLIFLSLVLLYLIQISAPIMFILNIGNISANPERIIIYMPYMLFSVICGWVVIGTLIFLMCKKGALQSAPLDITNN